MWTVGCREGDAANRAQQQASLVRTDNVDSRVWVALKLGERPIVWDPLCVCRSVCGCQEPLVIAAPRLSALTSNHAQIPC